MTVIKPLLGDGDGQLGFGNKRYGVTPATKSIVVSSKAYLSFPSRCHE